MQPCPSGVHLAGRANGIELNVGCASDSGRSYMIIIGRFDIRLASLLGELLNNAPPASCKQTPGSGMEYTPQL